MSFQFSHSLLVMDKLSNAKHIGKLINLPPVSLNSFPTGTCINNTSVMMFKKGSFEVTKTIYPVAIKVYIIVNKSANY